MPFTIRAWRSQAPFRGAFQYSLPGRRWRHILRRHPGVIEFFGGLMIAIGLLTSYAAFIASGEMAVAYFMAHFPRHPLPIINQGELAVLFCFVFLYIAAQGSGVWSVDALIGKRRANPHTRRVITVRTCILIVVVLTLASITLAQSSQTKKRNGFSLFNGEDLTGWHLRNPAGLCAVSKAERIGCLRWRSLSALVEVLRCSALCTRTIRVVACDSRGQFGASIKPAMSGNENKILMR